MMVEEKKQGSCEVIGRNIISELPPELFDLIMSNLPFLNLLACRQVCKAWNTLISSWQFSDSNLFIAQIYTFSGQMLQIVDLDVKHSKGMNVVASSNLNNPSRSEIKIEIVNSCKGLVLCTLEGKKTFCGGILNPMTNEYMKIPGIKNGEYLYGLGFSGKTKQYKIARHWFMNHKPSIEIFALGSRNSKWRCIGVASLGSEEETFYMKRDGVCWNGAIYWFGCHVRVLHLLDEVRNGMWRLNVEDEKFEEICCPSFRVSDGCFVHYGVVNGSLYLTHYAARDFVYNVWRKDGDEGLWVREFVIDNPRRPNPSNLFLSVFNYDIQLIKFYGDGKMLFVVHGVSLVLYDHETGRMDKLDNHPGVKPILCTWKIDTFHFDSLCNILSMAT